MAAAARGRAADPTTGASLLTLDAAGRIANASAGAASHVDALGGTFPDQLPAPIAAVVEACRAAQLGGATQPSFLRCCIGPGQWLKVSATPLRGTGPHQIVVSIERADRAHLAPLLVAAFELTPREVEIVQGVIAGATTHGIADTLCISPYTVQDHLKSIFAKTGHGTRRELVAALTRDGTA